MTRDRLQDSTALYRDRVDYQDIVRGFAERRGFPTTRVLTDFVKANLHYLRKRFDKLATAFDGLSKPPMEHPLENGHVMEQGRGVGASETGKSRPAGPLRAQPPDLDQGCVRPTGPEKARANMPLENPLIEASPDIAPLDSKALRTRAGVDLSARPSLATARDIAGRIYIDPDRAVDQMVARYAETGDQHQLVSEVERRPETFGDLRGRTRLGIANAERRSALEQAQVMARQIETVTEALRKIEARIAEQHDQWRQAMTRPLPDLSSEAGQVLQQVAELQKAPSGPTRDAAARLLLSDRASMQEVGRFQQALAERYGRGHETVAKGLEADPGLARKPSAERQQAQLRIQSVLQAVPVINQMRDRMRQQDRAPDLGRDKSRGIQR
ncbi:hypothetical protein [Marivita sp. S0852]|uniref:hypothetical protein n=1 Tax=Marivita sp. S0852 TaxID=3373893 RepID=UPI003981ADC8